MAVCSYLRVGHQKSVEWIELIDQSSLTEGWAVSLGNTPICKSFLDFLDLLVKTLPISCLSDIYLNINMLRAIRRTEVSIFKFPFTISDFNLVYTCPSTFYCFVVSSVLATLFYPPENIKLHLSLLPNRRGTTVQLNSEGDRILENSCHLKLISLFITPFELLLPEAAINLWALWDGGT